MKQTKFLFLCAVLWCSHNVTGQIEVPEREKEPSEDQIQAALELPPKEVETEAFIYTNWSQTSRVLEPNSSNGGLYADSLGIRADEIPLNVWSFGLGVRSQLRKNFMWQGGISWIRNGEAFDFQTADSSLSYQTYYNYIAMPLKIMYRYGERVSVYGGVGLVPQMFFSFRQERQWKTGTNFEDRETVKTRNGYNTFVLSGVGNIGVQLRMNSGVSIFAEGEYRQQFTSSYETTDSFEHYGRAFGVNLGMTYPL